MTKIQPTTNGDSSQDCKILHELYKINNFHLFKEQKYHEQTVKVTKHTNIASFIPNLIEYLILFKSSIKLLKMINNIN